MSSPTARSLTFLRQLGYVAAVVERWLPRIERKQDLFGIADILAVHPRDRAVLLVQATTAAHVPDRLRRILTRPELPALIRAGIAVEVWGWRQQDLKRVAVSPENVPVVVEPIRRQRKRKGERQGLLFGETT